MKPQALGIIAVIIGVIVVTGITCSKEPTKKELGAEGLMLCESCGKQFNLAEEAGVIMPHMAKKCKFCGKETAYLAKKCASCGKVFTIKSALAKQQGKTKKKGVPVYMSGGDIICPFCGKSSSGAKEGK